MKNPPAKPRQLITKEFAKQLNLNYNSKRANLVAESTQKEDANAIWYSLEELENYIHYIKIKGAKDGYTVDGIRFYFGVYPDDEKYGEKAGLTTLFLAPTGKKTVPKTQNNVARVLSFAATSEEEPSSDIQSIEPMNYGNIGRPPSLLY